jgi:hypothetical protein
LGDEARSVVRSLVRFVRMHLRLFPHPGGVAGVLRPPCAAISQRSWRFQREARNGAFELGRRIAGAFWNRPSRPLCARGALRGASGRGLWGSPGRQRSDEDKAGVREMLNFGAHSASIPARL